ncbi:uncharacterized protein RAG0_13920 [Rhynchosporium agropyri]|uniref:Uncharacterized protein n=2 Tax=Rhynchosporium TaxID=38037 RepID=A0A1E1LXU7_RHYSE|nr:uncharacterized protein RAG0_13920 [Rhynchosporium agropyri]CZT41694.1 uncharacterized protein RSE6_01462 [Rhynchosporium secalis]
MCMRNVCEVRVGYGWVDVHVVWRDFDTVAWGIGAPYSGFNGLQYHEQWRIEGNVESWEVLDIHVDAECGGLPRFGHEHGHAVFLSFTGFRGTLRAKPYALLIVSLLGVHDVVPRSSPW